MIKLMRESTDERVQFEAAKAAAPYVHPRITAEQSPQDQPTEPMIDVTPDRAPLHGAIEMFRRGGR